MKFLILGRRLSTTKPPVTARETRALPVNKNKKTIFKFMLFRLFLFAFLTLTTAGAPALYSAIDLGNTLCIGDSITEGQGGLSPAANGYTWRYDFWKHLVDNGDTCNFVGTRTSNYSSSVAYPTYTPATGPLAGQVQTFVNKHEAIWGTNMPERYDKFRNTPLLNTLAAGGNTPDTVFIFLGGNGISTGSTVNAGQISEIISATKGIINLLRGNVFGITGNANVDIYLISVIPRFAGKTPDARNANGFSALNESFLDLAAAQNVTFVDICEELNDSKYYYDGVHPNALGQARIAGLIYEAVAANQIPEPSTYGMLAGVGIAAAVLAGVRRRRGK